MNLQLGAPQPLTAAHRTDEFECGEGVLDEWLKRRAMANQLRLAWTKNRGVSYSLQGHEIIEHYANGRIVKSVKFRTYSGATGVAVTNSTFEEADGTVNLVYSLVDGEVVQGSPERESYFASILASSNHARLSALDATDNIQSSGLQASAITDNIGRAVLPAANLQKKLSIFWNNGAKWVKMAGSVDTTAQVVSVRTSRLGSYQLRQAAQSGDTTLVQVYPRIFTPNDDGANDVVIFQYGEGALSGGLPTGEIFDLNSAKVATLRPGPDPATTLMWDGKSESGEKVGAGIYIYQLTIEGTTVNGTVVVAK